MSWVVKIDRLLTPRRMSYAWIAGAALWLAWMASIVFGPGNMDLAGQVIGTDYMQFYAAGTTFLHGQNSDLYNFSYQSLLEQEIAGPGLTSFHAFITPPFLAWLYVPFAALPYTWSFFAWSLLGFLFLWLSIKLIGTESPKKAFIWSLTFFPIFAAISFGQNSLLSMFLFSLTFWLWKKDKYFAAGLVSSLLLYKPQMALGLGILWLLEWRKSWKSLLGLTIGGSILAGLCFWLLPGASHEYIDLARNFLPGLIYQEEFPIWHLQSLRGFWILLTAGNRWFSEGLSLAFSLLGVVAYFFFWRRFRNDRNIAFAGAICLTIWISPHAMIYDWSILVIPAILFWQAFPELRMLLKVLYTLAWIAVFISTPLTIAQLKVFPVAIQISMPVLVMVFFIVYRQTLREKRDNGTPELAEQ
jgi:alpha-1,2-mannosyltransferase